VRTRGTKHVILADLPARAAMLRNSSREGA